MWYARPSWHVREKFSISILSHFLILKQYKDAIHKIQQSAIRGFLVEGVYHIEHVIHTVFS